jgi:predicted Zn-dependent protease with MMP-like domain
LAVVERRCGEGTGQADVTAGRPGGCADQNVDFARAEQLEAVDLSDKWELTGLYEGEALPDRSIWSSGRMPARIWLFREPLIAEWRATGVRMEDLVRHVVVHEAGHHFGFSDDDMHRLEDDA